VTASAAIVVAWLVAGVPAARADDTASVAAATVLFDEAVKLMDAGRHAEACPKLARSQALAPSGGTLLALGECYERVGRSASAWVAFREAATRAASAGKRDAEASALERASRLATKLPRLTLTIAPASRVAGLEVRRDGEIVTEAELGIPVPIDPGPHEIRATAPQRRPWASSVTMQSGVAQEIAIPPLAGEPAVAGKVAEPGPPAETVAEGTTQRVVGLVVAGAGLVSVAVGGVFALRAKSKNEEALEPRNCPTEKLCTPSGLALTDSARSSALVSTVLVALGATGLAVGGVVFFTAPKSGAPRAGVLHFTPTWAAGSVGGMATAAW